MAAAVAAAARRLRSTSLKSLDAICCSLLSNNPPTYSLPPSAAVAAAAAASAVEHQVAAESASAAERQWRRADESLLTATAHAALRGGHSIITTGGPSGCLSNPERSWGFVPEEGGRPWQQWMESGGGSASGSCFMNGFSDGLEGGVGNVSEVRSGCEADKACHGSVCLPPTRRRNSRAWPACVGSAGMVGPGADVAHIDWLRWRQGADAVATNSWHKMERRRFCTSGSTAVGQRGAEARGQLGKLSVGQPSHETHPELLQEGEVLPGMKKDEFVQRRAALMRRLPPGSVLLVAAAPVKFMAGRIPYPYRQGANFFYLTGCMQPGGLLILQSEEEMVVGKGGGGGGGRGGGGSGAEDGEGKLERTLAVKSTMFTQRRSSEEVRWDGQLAGPDAATRHFGADMAFDTTRFAEVAGTLIEKKAAEGKLFADLTEGWGSVGESVLRSIAAKGRLRSSLPALHDQRWKKSTAEINLMRRSASISCQAFLRAMAASRKVPDENHVASVFEFECRRRGAQRLAYPSVSAAGSHACTVHYLQNYSRVKPTELLLLDGGCEFFGYASDITRVWSPQGQFSTAQRDVYEAVLTVMKECVALCEPGNRLIDIHNHSVLRLSQFLCDLGVLKIDASRAVLGAYKPFYPTAVGHWLGLDTHDCSNVFQTRPLEEGVVLTIEPGLYLPDSPEVPKELRGIGVRIEDDILITKDGHMNMTASVPKEVDQLNLYLSQYS